MEEGQSTHNLQPKGHQELDYPSSSEDDMLLTSYAHKIGANQIGSFTIRRVRLTYYNPRIKIISVNLASNVS